MNKKREKFVKNLLDNLNQKKARFEEEITQAKKRMSGAEGPMQSWSNNTQTDLEEEIAILTSQLRTVEAQTKEIKSLSKQEISSKRVAIGSLITVEIDGEKQTFLLISSPVASFEQGVLSTHSPIGKSLIGKKKDQSITLSTPAGSSKIKVLEAT